MKDEACHQGHRSRIRSRYFAHGIKGMTDCDIVEMLLFFGIPYRDTNEIAHRLISTFGDLKGVLNAPAEELVKISGVGENAAALIRLVRDIAQKINDDADNGDGEKDNISAFLIEKYADENNEVFSVISLDSNGAIKNFMKVCGGFSDKVTVDNRRIMEVVLRMKAKQVIIAHNHPNGTAYASDEDVKATGLLKELLNSVGIRLIDHAIVAGGACILMSEDSAYERLFKKD